MTSVLRSLKLLLCLAPVFLFIVFFRPIVQTSLGAVAKFCLRHGGDCELAYRRLEWKEGNIVLSDAVLFELGAEKSSFHVHADTVSLRLDWRSFPWRLRGHLTVSQPHILLSHYRPAAASKKWMQLTMEVREGLIEWAGIGRALFSYERAVPDQLGQMKLIFDETDLFVEAVEQNGTFVIHAEGKGVQAPVLQSFLSFYRASSPLASTFTQGELQGNLHLVLEKDKAVYGSMFLQIKDLAAKGKNWSWKGLEGSIDWEGSCAPVLQCGLLADLLPKEFPSEARVRCELKKADVTFPEGIIEGLQGHFSYNGGMGAKWDLQGTGLALAHSFPLHFKGRSYFHSQRENWLETQLQFEPTLSPLTLQGKEVGSERIWALYLEHLTPDKSTFLQSIGACWNPHLLEGHLRQGQLRLEGEWVLAEAGVKSWQVKQFVAEHVLFDVGDVQIGWEKAAGCFSEEQGDISLAGGYFTAPLPEGKRLEGTKWDGECVWEEGILTPSSFQGNLGPERILGTVRGTWQDWNLQLQAEQFLQGSLQLAGSWEKSHCSINALKGQIEGVQITGNAGFDLEGHYFLKLEQFQGEIGGFAKLGTSSFSGTVQALENGLEIRGDQSNWEWSLHAALDQGAFPRFQIEKARMEVIADAKQISCYAICCDWKTPRGAVQLESPSILRKGTDWTFDVRVKSPTWDLVRLTGTSDEKSIAFDTQRSHLLGASFQIGSCRLGKEDFFQELDIRFDLPWKSVLAAGPYLTQFGVPSFVQLPLQGEVSIDLHYVPKQGSSVSIKDKNLKWKGESIGLDLHAEQEKGRWQIHPCQIADVSLICSVTDKEGILCIENGRATWREGILTDFQGKIDPQARFDFSLSKMKMDLAQLSSLTSLWGMPIRGVQGIVEGEGHFVYHKGLESDFDFTLSELRTETFLLENQGSVHLFFSPEKGVAIQGLDLQAQHIDKKGVWLKGKIDLVQYDSSDSSWILTHSHLHLPSEFFTALSPSSAFSQRLSPKSDWDLVADWKCASDFSTLSCLMEEGFVPIFGEVRHLQHLELEWTPEGCLAICDTTYKGHALRVGLQVENDSILTGRLILKEQGEEKESPLVVHWQYLEGQGLVVHAIEGTFAGIEASFHAETVRERNVLIGSARMHFSTLSPFLPDEIAQVFQQLKMGKGYELKGRLTLEGADTSFRGILSGKAVELFGFQFRTLLAQVDLSAQHVYLSNLKISDTAGILKIDEIAIQGQADQPWTISIPQLTVSELRPTLLQKVGQEGTGTMSPLVIREFKLLQFKGDLEDSKTYTAKGYLKFVNTYKREKTVFDLPSDVLGRIVGLDLELFIPVCGTLEYDLREGFFNLLELKGAFSEGQRSEFLLETGLERGPFMDLEGNLKILIKMKQFVLFKLTDAFLISIEGNLTDPQFHLQKKKRFWGL